MNDIESAAQTAATEIADTLCSVLNPTEMRLFLSETTMICRALIEAAMQQAMQNVMRMASAN